MKNFKILSWLFAILLLFSHMHTNAVVINNPDGTKVWFNGCPPGETCPLSKADSIYLGIFQAITAVIQNTACSGSGVRNVDSIYQHYDTIFYAINGTTYYLPQSSNLFSDTSEIKYYTVLLSTNTPIVSPVTGATYLVGTSPSGVWASHAKDIAVWNGSSWTYYDGVQGNYLYNTANALTYQYRSSNWMQTTGIPILNNGNTISTGVRLGTNNLKSLTFETNNIARGRIDSIGRFYVYDTALRKLNKYLQVDEITGRMIASEIDFSTDNLKIFKDTISNPGIELIGLKRKDNSIQLGLFTNDDGSVKGIFAVGLEETNIDENQGLDNQALNLMVIDKTYGLISELPLDFLGQIEENIAAEIDEKTDKTFNLGTIFYTDINAASANSAISINLSGSIPMGYFPVAVTIDVITPFAQATPVVAQFRVKTGTASAHLMGEVLDLYSGVKFTETNGSPLSKPNAQQQDTVELYFDNGNSEVNPKDYTAGEVFVRAICKKFPN